MNASDPDPRMAVIGMAFRLPGADTPEDFWRIIRDGTDRITRFTDEELAAAGVPAEEYEAEDFVGASGLLEDIAGFDAQHFGMSPREARVTDPQQRMFLECAQHALENAGYPDERGGTRVGVYASTRIPPVHLPELPAEQRPAQPSHVRLGGEHADHRRQLRRLRRHPRRLPAGPDRPRRQPPDGVLQFVG
ncbi:hypothetical protein SVIOM74S_10356 [Streptomyces violarus]